MEFGKNTNKSLFDLSLLAAFTTYCIAEYMLMFTFTVMAFRDRWRNLFNFLLNRFLPLKKPLILILWPRRDFIESPIQRRRKKRLTLWKPFGKTTNNNKQTKIKFRRTEKYFISKLFYWAYYVVVQFFSML